MLALYYLAPLALLQANSTLFKQYNAHHLDGGLAVVLGTLRNDDARDVWEALPGVVTLGHPYNPKALGLKAKGLEKLGIKETHNPAEMSEELAKTNKNLRYKY